MQKKSTYLLIGHGSPNSAGNKHLTQFAQKVEQALGESVTLGALEHFEPDLDSVIAQVCQEADEIRVMPLFLFAAYHCKKDIPTYIERAQKQYPDKKFHVSPALGAHPLMIDIVNQSIEQVLDRSAKVDPKETLLLVIGRGTSDQEVIEELKGIGKQVQKKWNFGQLEFCYMAVNKPTIEDGFALCRQTTAKRIIVVPYLLFYGVLLDKIIKSFQEINQSRPETEVHVSKVLGNHPNVVEAVLERAKEESGC